MVIKENSDMNYVTSRDIMRATGIANVATLVRWHGHERLIPPPEIRTHPNGRGKMAYWPEWVLHRCIRIKQLRKEGKSLAEIREFLGSDWTTAAQNHGRRYKFAEASLRIEKDAALSNVRDVVTDFLMQWINTLRGKMQRTTLPSIHASSIDAAIEMLQQGINPVFVLTSESAYLTADFAVSIHLSKCRSVDQSFMVVPIWKELSAYLDKITSFPKSPSIYPIARVARSMDSAVDEAAVTVLSSWEFEIQSPRSSSQKTRNEDAAHAIYGEN
jgi:DNA-binding transcriptional MerR regulator